MARVAWVFTDPELVTTLNLEVNPSDGGAPGYRRSTSSQNTLAPGGNVVLYEGQDPPKTIEFSGTVLTKPQYAAFLTWFKKQYLIQITDHLSRVMTVRITSFVPTPKPARTHPYRHTYTASAVVTAVSDLDVV